MGRSPRSRRLLMLKLLLLGATLLVSLAAIELGLRLCGFKWHLYPEKVEFGYPGPVELELEFVADRDLFWVTREYKPSLEWARANHPEIVFMGCSCTEYSSYPEQVTRRIDESVGRPVKSIKLANVGWSTYQGLMQLRRDVAPLRPRIVTIFYGWNDHWIGFGITDVEAARVNDSLLFKAMRLRLVQLLGKAIVGVQGRAHEGYPLRVPEKEFRANLTDMVRLARAAGITPMLITAPTSHQQGREPEYLKTRWFKDLDKLVPTHRRYAAIVREVAAAQGAVLCDLAAEFDKLPRERLDACFESDGIHFTDAGSEEAARVVFECFARNGLQAQLHIPAAALTDDQSTTIDRPRP
jgi:lysophospholipase L1-like esterase